MTRFTFTQLGNCLDIHDAKTGHTVAFINITDKSPEEAFADWLAKHDKPASESALGLKEMALLFLALIIGFIVLPIAVAAFG